MAAAISTKKKTHSMAQAHTKMRMRALVAAGLMRPMVNQIPTPETAPKTSVTRMKKRLWVTR